jgi:hypothetical protein
MIGEMAMLKTAKGTMMETLTEARRKPRTLADLTPKRAFYAQQAAMMRLQLWFTGETHRIVGEFAQVAKQRLNGVSGEMDGMKLFQVQHSILSAWNHTFLEEWLPLFQAARREAASIPFGTLAILHERYVRKPAGKFTEDTDPGPVFEPQLQELLDAAANRIYGDGLTLSSRIWKLDRDAREGINRVLMAGVANKRSAWDIARDLESYLGAGQDCPRWTRTRLDKLTKKDIASGDRRGLVTGAECGAKGVAYNALRMARTELQAAHHAASDRIMEAQPWIEKEQVVLSPAHPKPDICDDVIAAGEGGQGIYPKGGVTLPLHPHCLCFKTSVLPDPSEFVDQLRTWANGGADPALDDYAAFAGAQRDQVLGMNFLNSVVAQALGVWLWGKVTDMARRTGQ